MSKYRKTLDRRDAFTPQEADAAIFTPENVDELAVSDRTIVRSIKVADISPDPGQPRRIVPSVILAVAGRTSIPFIFDTWAVMAFKETSGNDAPPDQAHELYRAMIEGRLETEGWQLPEKPGYIEASIMAVAELAANIRQVGLTNPITIAPAPEGLVDSEYIIETGERRFWAYRMLNFYYGPDWLKIPAKVQPEVDIWKQAAENNQRSDLNAIGKARQLAILLMDLLQKEEYEKARKEDRAAVKLFAPMTGFLREQEYYAQVADAAKWRVPHGKIEQLLPAMGLKNRVNLSQYRAMLKLPPELWIEADDRNYSRDSLLQIVTAGNILDDERVDFTKPLPQPLPTSQARGEGSQAGGNISQVSPALPKGTPPPAPPHFASLVERGGNAGAAVGEGRNIPNGVSQPGKPSAQESVVGVGKWVYVKDGRIGIVSKRISSSLVEVEIDGRYGPHVTDSLKPAPMQVGMAVQTRTRHVGWIVGGVGSDAIQVKYNGAVTTHRADSLKPVNRASEKEPLPQPLPQPLPISQAHGEGQKPAFAASSQNDADWETDKPKAQPIEVQAVPKLTLSEIRYAVERMIGGEHDEDDLDVMRRFFIERSHDLGILTPWDSDAAITAWLSDDLVNNGEVADGLTLERVDTAQHVLGQARRWFER